MSDPHAPYILHKMDVSYFSGKLEAYLRHKQIPFTARTADARGLNQIYRHTGVKKVPALHTADDLWLFDTTPTMAWLEARYPQRPTVPEDPALAFLAHLLEDYADEWLWRPAMWWRWEPLPSRKALGWRIALEVHPPGVPPALMAWFFAQRQRRTWLWGDGMHRGNAAQIRDLYPAELQTLEAVLRQQPYLLGAQPSAADFGYFGSMFRHFGNDPDAAEVMRRTAPAVYEWLARLWNSGDHPTGPTQWQWPDAAAWAPLWQRIGGDYLPYLAANAQAYADGQKRFDHQGETLALRGTRTHRYRVWCRQELQRKFAALSAAAQARVSEYVPAGPGLADLSAGPTIDAGLDALYQLPKASGQYRPSLRVALFGQPRD